MNSIDMFLFTTAIIESAKNVNVLGKCDQINDLSFKLMQLECLCKVFFFFGLCQKLLDSTFKFAVRTTKVVCKSAIYFLILRAENITILVRKHGR